ncbi:MAG TPA: hypothetical protein VIV60_02785 [Polyangiaceae bacterium]
MSNTAELLATLLSGFFPPMGKKRQSLPPTDLTPNGFGSVHQVSTMRLSERPTLRLLRLVGRYRGSNYKA